MLFEDEDINYASLRTKPFLKWAGGKYRLVPILQKCFPKNKKRFVEPFVGSASVSLNVSYGEYLINDYNEDVSNIFSVLKEHEGKFISDACQMFSHKNNTQEKYYEFREEFNSISDKYRKSILFLYLNRHCFNGLCRV